MSQIDEAKDIGVTVHENLKPSVHCNQSAKKANCPLNCLLFLKHFTTETMLHLSIFMNIMWDGQLEFSVPVWCPWSVGDKETIKKKFKKGRSQWFQDSLVHRTVKKHKELNLSQSLRYDTIETYKIIHGVNNVNKCTWF